MLFINIKLEFETAMSEFHQFIITILKVKPDKLPPRITEYRIYQSLERKAFHNNLQVSLE